MFFKKVDNVFVCASIQLLTLNTRHIMSYSKQDFATFEQEWVKFLKHELECCIEFKDELDMDADIKALQAILVDPAQFIKTVYEYMIQNNWELEFMLPLGSEDRQFHRGWTHTSNFDHTQQDFHQFVQAKGLV